MARRVVSVAVGLMAFALSSGLSACGGDKTATPTQPTTPGPSAFPSFAGVWTATFQVTRCTGTGPIWCTSYLQNPDSVVLRLTQSGSQVSGAFVDGTQEWASLQGTIDGQGLLNMSGGSPESALGFCGGGVTMDHLTLRLNATDANFGSFEWFDHRPSSCLTPYNPTYKGRVLGKAGRITSLVRTEESAALLAATGQWWGHALAACEGPSVPQCKFPRGHANYGECGAPLCDGSTQVRVRFRFDDSGGPVVGTLTRWILDGADDDEIAFRGTAAGGQLHLEADQTRTDFWGAWQTRTSDVSLQVDAVGRLIGTFVLNGEFRRTDGEIYRWRKRYTLADVIYYGR